MTFLETIKYQKTIILLLTLFSIACTNISIEEEIVGEYNATISDELNLGFEVANYGLSQIGDFGKFTASITNILAQEISINFIFNEDKTGKFTMTNNGFFSQLTGNVQKENTNFNYTIENDTALFFYEDNMINKIRTGTLILNEYQELEFIKIKLNKEDYGFLYLKLTKILED